MDSVNLNNVTALILAGVRGQRMGDIYNSRPKPLLSFAGQFKVIDFVLNNCLNSGIGRIAAAVERQDESIESHLNTWKVHFQSPQNIATLFPKKDSYGGTADAIYQNLDLLQQWNSEILLILSGDHVYNMDYRQLISSHIRSQADVTVATIAVPKKDAHRFGIVMTDKSGRIVGFEEQPTVPKSSLASMGVYVFNKKALCRHLEEDAMDPNSHRDIEFNVIPKMIQMDQCYSYRFNDYWCDISTPESYLASNLDLCSYKTLFHFDPSWDFNAQMTQDSEPLFGPDATVINSLISPGCIVNGTVINSVLSPGVVIGENSRVIASVIMQNAKIKADCIVNRCIIEEEELIPAGSSVGISFLNPFKEPVRLSKQGTHNN